MDPSLPTPPASASAAFAVLTSRVLLPQIAQYQNGIPLLILELLPVFDAHLPAISQGDKSFVNKIGRFWASALFCGDVASIQLLCRMRQWPEFANDTNNMKMTDLPKYAAMSGRLDVLLWLHEHQAISPAPWHGEMLNDALYHGHVELAQWLIVNRHDACTKPIYETAMNTLWENFEQLRGLIAFGPQVFAVQVLDEVLQRHNWEMIWYLHEHAPVAFTSRAMDHAAKCGHLDIVTFLHENRTEGCTTRAMDDAACHGHLNVVKFLHENRTEGCTTYAMDGAAANDHLSIVEYLHDHRSEGCTTQAMDEAATHGRLDIVLFLHDNRAEGCTVWTMKNAAENGHLDVVRFLQEHRREGYTDRTMDVAAERGHLHVVQYLHENDMDCCVDAMDRAVCNGHVAVLQYLHDNRPECSCTMEAMERAATQGHIEVIKFLHEKRGMVVHDALLNRVLEQSQFAVVRYLHEEMNKPFDETSAMILASLRDEKLIEYVTSRLPEGVIVVGERNVLVPAAQHAVLFGSTESDY